ncbi:cellobiohydrolaseI [Mycena alexandri]|uniref:Glucanase n=1 Tax=Mycena alexandri TaxID=1745969 RepID=A0AAD6TG92_9AGAR|nr:cellobiohydrolaseI [Mycena alexandri]
MSSLLHLRLPPASVLASLCLLGLGAVYGQQVGTEMPEIHPILTTQQCSAPGVCTARQSSVTLDSNWRPLHSVSSPTSCFNCNSWDSTLCPDPATCASNCGLDGVDYAGSYGITSNGSSLALQFVTGCNVGSRVFLMSSSSQYQIFTLLNQEFTFTVDMSHLECGVNAGLYLLEMDADGGRAKFPTNKAGANYGTGYCDAQCGQDAKFTNGIANVLDWTPSPTDPVSGTGLFGSCCNSIDVWQGNMHSAAYSAHPCSVAGQTQCSGAQCDNSLCDADGCDFNPWRMGNTSFLGPGKVVDTTIPLTVVTQFITNTNTATGTLTEIRRLYVQNGKVIQNANVNLPGIPASLNSITDNFCAAQKTAVGDPDRFEALGGLATMSAALKKGMVLALSIRDDYTNDLLWLDGNFPPTALPTAPGVSRGPCSASSGNPEVIEDSQANDFVVFSNIKWGPIGSTFS